MYAGLGETERLRIALMPIVMMLPERAACDSREGGGPGGVIVLRGDGDFLC